MPDEHPISPTTPEQKDEATLSTSEVHIPGQVVAIEGEEFPEGGWQAWITVFGAALVQFSTFGYTNAFGVFQGQKTTTYAWKDFYVREYLTKYTPSQIGWIGGIQIFLVLGSGIFTGRIFDKGYFRYLMIVGGLLHPFSFFMLSLSHKNEYYQVFLSQGLGGGLGAGIVNIPTLAIVSHYFSRRRPLAMGFVVSGVALGAVLHPIILNHLLYSSRSFGEAIRISAGINAAILFLGNLCIRPRLSPKKAIGAIPFAEFSRDTPYLFLLLGGVLIIYGFSFPVFFLQLYGVANGIGHEFSLYCLPIMNTTSIIGRIFPAIFAPRLGVVNMTIACVMCMGTLICCLSAVKNVGGMVAFAVIYGFFSGASVSLTPAMLASLAKDIDEIGARIGVSFALSGIVGLFAAPIAGALLTSQLHWWHAILFGGTTMLGGSFCYVVARFLLVQRRRTQIV